MGVLTPATAAPFGREETKSLIARRGWLDGASTDAVPAGYFLNVSSRPVTWPRSTRTLSRDTAA